ncbi:RabGAP/TBC [Microthyrium microscopicum]|uniref:RabGAP/TBC n=1 Tax=Microthyrium microscopicum TaxID=703497 RepID=A0A6A6TWK7_9PEZI|nr:RabGAP/TBC [Microthyrium microscopicum]
MAKPTQSPKTTEMPLPPSPSPLARPSSKTSRLASSRPQTAKSAASKSSLLHSAPLHFARPATAHNHPSNRSSTRPSTATAATTAGGVGEWPGDKRLPTPKIVVHDGSGEVIRPDAEAVAGNSGNGGESFLPMIPTGDLDDLDDLMGLDRMQFSNRGSIIMLDGLKRQGTPKNGSAAKSGLSKSSGSNMGLNSNGNNGTAGTPKSPSKSITEEPRGTRSGLSSPTRSSRVLSADEASLSQRVRSMYEYGTEDPSLAEQTLLEEDEDEDTGLETTNGALSPNILDRSVSRNSTRRDGLPKSQHEAAGGIEDWEDINGDEIDRYGFIIPRPSDSRSSQISSTLESTSPSVGLQRVSTSLLEASNTPRKRSSMLRRMPSRASTNTVDGTPRRQPSRRSLNPKSTASIYSHKSNKSAAVNGSTVSLRGDMSSKERKLLVAASDMLTLPPGVAESKTTTPASASISRAAREKEWSREAKWKKMGRLRSNSNSSAGAKEVGSGMHFDFDPHNPKVISRTWKGIPDRWRATAWYSFLAASARTHPASPSESMLRAAFHEHQLENCADDVQIDCDVPRTINRHIMFRRRYRGGQRLLFRVLHALALYFPEVGYVQGMAALAATLLCYYDEELAFVMMVRLWQLRGLSRLYESGFEGLMDALTEFETAWLRGGEVARTLEELGIHSTAYGTRWYLTLFNYSIPFPAQLRVWDVFMLLGDSSLACNPKNGFGADLDVLHATSAALIDATRDILVTSDFENAMKVLTSWIPIKDEDLLMKVANAEWKQRKRRAAKEKEKEKV